MNETHGQSDGTNGGAATDVFAAARWLDELWNSSAKAVSPDRIEWQCNTWGSGRRRCDWLDTANFIVVAEIFGFEFWSNDDGRDELVVAVPLDRFPQVAGLISRLGEEPEAWPWLSEDDVYRQIEMAAEFLRVPTSAVSDNDTLAEALGMRPRSSGRLATDAAKDLMRSRT